ncbi:hypothetical protein [Mycobacterium sp. TY813]|nr:hypothetical protein [Mycobacterium sp. TY813]MDP7729529.1 hypothetical protein [Mycobacterium sp. TY813]
MHDDEWQVGRLGPVTPPPTPQPAHPIATLIAAWFVVFSAVLVALWIWF